MRPQKVQDKEMLQALMSVFRAKGYDGASLSELAAASGLKKASLYHRFPEGKKEMTSAVLNFLETWVEQHIYQVLTNDAVPVQKRVSAVLKNIKEIYHDGTECCIYRALSMDTGIALFGEQIKTGINKLSGKF